MIERFLVRIASENETGKVIEDEMEADSLIGAARVIHTFKPKRGYVAFHWQIDKVEVMV